jgi:hypothetical protein
VFSTILPLICDSYTNNPGKAHTVNSIFFFDGMYYGDISFSHLERRKVRLLANNELEEGLEGSSCVPNHCSGICLR